jgi:hypothetical protein
MTKKTQTKKSKTASPDLNAVESALKQLNKSNQSIEEINKAVQNTNYSELTDFVMKFSMSKDCQLMFRLLARLQENPQTFRGKDEFNTVYDVALLDGERQLVRKFANIIAKAMDGNRLEIERELTKNPFI